MLKDFRSKLILFVATSLLCIFAIEAASRLLLDGMLSRQPVLDQEYGSFYQFDQVLGYRPRPSIRSNFNNHQVTHDQYAFRAKDLLSSYETSKKTVVFLGDSLAWGYGVDDNNTLSELTKFNWNSKHPDNQIQTMNLGVSGYSSDQAFLRFILDGEKWNPEILVWIHFFNDPFGSVLDFDKQTGKPFLEESQGQMCLNAVPVKHDGFEVYELKQMQKKQIVSVSLIEFFAMKIFIENFSRSLESEPSLLLAKYFSCFNRVASPTRKHDYYFELLFWMDQQLANRGYQVLHVFAHNNAKFNEVKKENVYDRVQAQLLTNGRNVLQTEVLFRNQRWSKERIANSELDPHHFSPPANKLVANAISERIAAILKSK